MSNWKIKRDKMGSPITPRQKIAENFRRMLLRHHEQWDPSFEIAFWRQGSKVICEVQDSDSPIDRINALRIRANALRMRRHPLRLIRLKRKALKLTLAQAAERAGLPRSHWNMVELG